MKNGCKPPKCAVVKEKCQCPNPWIEHLAHTAAERKTKGVKRLSIKQHAQDYKKTVRSGKYAARSSTRKICKSDSKLLCAWNAERKIQRRTMSIKTVTGSRVGEEYPPGGWDDDLLTLKSPKIKKFKQGHTYATTFKGRDLVFKEFEAGTVRERREFLFRTSTHLEMYKRLGDRVPRLYKAYLLERNGRRYGIHVMQRAPGVELGDFLKTHNSPEDLRQVSKHLKDMFEAFKKAKVWHGDLHAGNWIIDSTKNGDIRSLSLIDFDDSVVDAPGLGDKNVISFLDDIVMREKSTYLPLLPYMQEVGVDIPDDIMEWDDNDFDGEVSHLTDLAHTIVSNMSAEPDIKLETIHAGK